MAQIDVKPGSRTNIQPGNAYRLLPGVHLPISAVLRDVEIFGAEGPADSIIDGNHSAEFGIRGQDGSDNAQVRILTLRNCGHGMRITVASGVVVEDVISTGHAVEGAHLASVPGVVVRRFQASDLGLWRFQTYTQDKAHGLYIAGNSDGARVEDLRVENVGGSMLQMNAASTQEVMSLVTARRLLGIRCGQGGSGTLGFALMSVVQALFEEWRLENCNGIATLFDDGQGSRFACYDNAFGPYSLVSTPPTFRQQAGSARNVLAAGAGWTGQPAAPGSSAPSPEPPEDPCADVKAELAAALAENARMQADARAWLAQAPAWMK